MTINLSEAARQRLREVLDAMQNAEEMGGVEGKADYDALMDAIIAECTKRKAARGSLVPLGERQYTLDDGDLQYTTYHEFVEANKDGLDEEEIAEIEALGVGEEMTFGGGAAALAILRRVK